MAKYEVLRKPLTEREIEKAIRDSRPVDGFISEVVAVRLGEVIEAGGLDGFFDLLSNRLTGTELLMNIDYDMVGHKGDELHLRVSGDASQIVEAFGNGD